MLFRRCRTLIPPAASLLLAMAAFVGVGVVTAGPASAAPEITICLTNASSFCADVKDSDNVSGQPVWLWQPKQGANDYHWYEVPVPCDDLTCACFGQTCVEFEDAQNTNLCLGVSSNLRGISLIGCELTGVNGGTARAAWIQEGHYLVNFFLGAHSGYLAVNGPLFNGRYLYPSQSIAPGGSVWEQWSGP